MTRKPMNRGVGPSILNTLEIVMRRGSPKAFGLSSSAPHSIAITIESNTRYTDPRLFSFSVFSTLFRLYLPAYLLYPHSFISLSLQSLTTTAFLHFFRNIGYAWIFILKYILNLESKMNKWNCCLNSKNFEITLSILHSKKFFYSYIRYLLTIVQKCESKNVLKFEHILHSQNIFSRYIFKHCM